MKEPGFIKHPALLAEMFSASFVQKMLEGRHSVHVHKVFETTGFDRLVRKNASIKTALLKAYNFLSENYRCEYIFKTAIINEILIKRHSIQEANCITEFRTFNAKADVVILNGTSTVYEIKSDIDKLSRLPSQINAYEQIFDKVFVVSNEKNVSAINKIVSPNTGIMILNQDLSLVPVKEAKSNIEKLNKKLMFDCLRKPEYLDIIGGVYGAVPEVPNTLIHSRCKELFEKLPNSYAHKYFLDVLKKRQLPKQQLNWARSADERLRCLFLERKYSENEFKLIRFGLTETLSD